MSLVSDYGVSVSVALIAVLAWVFLRKRFSYFTERGIRYVKPGISSFCKSLSMTTLFDRPNDIYNEKKSDESLPYIGFFLGIQPQILLLQPSLVETVLIKDFSHFHDHGFSVDGKVNPLFNNLFNMNGDEWRTLRHKLVPTFTSGKLKGMIPVMEECAQLLIQDIHKDPSLRKDSDIKDLFRRYSLSVIAKCGFGIDPVSVQDPDCEFRRITNEVMYPNFYQMAKMSLNFMWPKFTNALKMKMFPKYCEDFFLNLTTQAFEMRKNTGIKRNDFIQLLLELKEKGSVQVDAKDLEQDEKDIIDKIQKEEAPSNLEFTDELLMAQVFVFLVGGFENTAYLAAVVMYVLSKHPDVQERVRKEVEEVKAKHGALSYLALRDMKLLGASIDEALRLYTPAVVLMRKCTKTYTLSDGKKIEKGTQVLIPAKGFHMDSQYWREPEKFNPDRFLEDQIHPGTYLPFGDGPRICIAQRLAILTAKVMIAKLVTEFKLLPSPKTKEPAKVKVLITADIDGGIWGSLEPIK